MLQIRFFLNMIFPSVANSAGKFVLPWTSRSINQHNFLVCLFLCHDRYGDMDMDMHID